jgi:hypothetical protein
MQQVPILHTMGSNDYDDQIDQTGDCRWLRATRTGCGKSQTREELLKSLPEWDLKWLPFVTPCLTIQI